MAKIKERGKSGAAKNYITRNQALKKLQCSLSDFRRLCILKGIFPREPTHKKRANKGSSAPASFYYQKDIQYLLHEPVLQKLREHKTFAKKLSRALGRGEWALAKGLEERRPVYKLDHILKERYPTFTDALRDIDDALCLISLFSRLPLRPTPTSTLPSVLPANSARLMAEWQLYIMKTKALRKVFFSIKGVYFQAEVGGQKVTWLEPYAFTQHVPTDVDFRILLTFSELYQTLLGFVLFKLYTDINLVYPPPFEQEASDAGAGVAAFILKESAATDEAAKPEAREGKKKLVPREVRKGIKAIEAGSMEVDEEETALPEAAIEEDEAAVEDDFVLQPTKSTGANEDSEMSNEPLPTFSSLVSSTTLTTQQQNIFASYTIYLSREVTRPTLEFIIRSFGGRVGWDSRVLGAGSPFTLQDPSITHVIVDRPCAADGTFKMGEDEGDNAGKRVYVQPQWVADCVNLGRLLPSEEYKPGAELPPHLSPFGVTEVRGSERSGTGKDVVAALGEDAAADEAAGELDEDDDEDDDEEEDQEDLEAAPPALLAAAANPSDDALLHAAELEAEKSGVPIGEFEAQLKKETKRAGGSVNGKKNGTAEKEEDLSRIMLSGKKKKLLEKMEYSNKAKDDERENLERKRKLIAKQKKAKEAKSLAQSG